MLLWARKFKCFSVYPYILAKIENRGEKQQNNNNNNNKNTNKQKH